MSLWLSGIIESLFSDDLSLTCMVLGLNPANDNLMILILFSNITVI